jgi:hypothetical protein
MNEWEEDDERRRISDELAYLSTLEFISCEVGKKRQQIDEWRALAAESRDRAAECDRLIKDAEERIAQLERHRVEVEQQEHHSSD